MTACVHGHDPEASSEALGHGRPKRRREPVGVVEQRDRAITTPILHRDLDTAFLEGHAATEDILGNQSLPAFGHDDRS